MNLTTNICSITMKSMTQLVTVDDMFTDITKALDEIDERLAFVVDRNELGDAMCAAVEVGHRVSALQARLGLLCDNNLVAAEAGQRTMGQYVAARTNSRGLDVDRKIKRAKWLREFPVLAAAHGAELTDVHVDFLGKHLDRTYDSHVALVGDQQFFVDTAATCSLSGFEQACEYWLAHIDPDGKEPIDQIQKASFRVNKGSGGRGEIKGQCDAATASDITTAVDHEAEKLRQDDKANGIERTNGQRKMAALAALVKRGFAREDGTYPVPLGNIVVSQKVLEWALNTLAGAEPGDTVPVHPTDPDGRCELIDGTPIHPFLAVHALGLISPTSVANPVNLRRYVVDAKSRVIDISVNARVAPEWMRTAINVQARGQCEQHGCDAPHSWLQMDHVDPVANEGETRFDNIQAGCRPDNQAKAATTGHIPWRDQPRPTRRNPRRRPAQRSDTSADDSDADADGGRF